MKNYWFIGDIHGEIRLLDQLLTSVLKFGPEQLVFVGDYIDRGLHSKEVVDRLMGLKIPVACLMGNHEMMMLNAMDDLGFGHSPIELWYYNGGEATLRSFGSTSFFSFQSELDPVYVAFFRNLKMSHIINVDLKCKVLGTHAGISPAIPLKDHVAMKNYNDLNQYMLENHIEPNNSFLWIREAYFNGPPSLNEGYLVIHGHTPILKMKRFTSSRGLSNFQYVGNDLCIRKDGKSGKLLSIDIDSGSVLSGRLTGLGFFLENEGTSRRKVRMRSITVTAGDIFPRDFGTIRALL